MLGNAAWRPPSVAGDIGIVNLFPIHPGVVQIEHHSESRRVVVLVAPLTLATPTPHPN